MYRIATSQFAQSAITTVNKHQTHINSLMQQISSGKRNDLDPIEKTQQISYSVSISNKAQNIRNGDTVLPNLVSQESALSAMTDKLIHLQETMIQAQNPIMKDEPSLKETVAAIKNDILSIANTKDSQGNYIFSGYKSQTKPFPDLNTYNGDQGISSVRIGENTSVNINVTGEKIITSNLTDAFNKIENYLNNGINDQTMIASVEKSLADVSLQRTITGLNINKIEKFKDINEDMIIKQKERLSQIEDTDMLKAVSELSAAKTATEASLKSYAMIQNLSLFNYL